jgi:tetratricopeptide (TPR) repeat protein
MIGADDLLPTDGRGVILRLVSSQEPRRLRAVPSPDEPATLLARARDALDHGRLADARRDFLAAARDDDPITRAEAAIGAGGLWLYELRVVDERAAYLELARVAHKALGNERPDLRLRLEARLAAEATYDETGTLDDLRAVVDDIRRLGNATALAESLSLLHHAMLTPRYAYERLEVADELVVVSATSGNATFSLMGLLWRTVDLFLIGDDGAERALSDLRLRSDQLDFAVGRYVVAAIDTMLLTRAGRLEEAEASAAACHQLGAAAGDVDAEVWYLAHLFAIRWLAGRGGELLPVVEQVARGTALVHSFAPYIWIATALVTADAGQLDQARVALDRMLASDLASLLESSVWLPALFGLAEAAARLDDAAAARLAVGLLEPYAALPIMGSLAIVCFGSAARSLGLAHRTLGDLEAAVGAFEDAIRQDRRLGHLPMTAITRADLAETLARRGQPGDAPRAQELLDAAIASAQALDLGARASRWTEQRERVVPGLGRMARRGEYWEVSAGHEVAVVRDSTGLRYVATLLGRPGRDVAAAELAGAIAEGGAQPVLDDRARRDYQRRIATIEGELDDADRAADVDRSARLRAELDALLDEVQRVVRPGGLSRSFVDTAERARTSVQKAVRRALASLGTDAPRLADGLSRSIRTGTTCRFDPAPEIPSRWDIRLDD